MGIFTPISCDRTPTMRGFAVIFVGLKAHEYYSYIYIYIINHSYWSYVQQISYLGAELACSIELSISTSRIHG